MVRTCFRARQLVSERLVQVDLPPGLSPQMSPISTGLGEIVYYTLDYKKDAPQRKQTRERQLMDLREAHDYIVKPFLRTCRAWRR
jgi:cobalt-zinc-cadmium resistance protein CzcA